VFLRQFLAQKQQVYVKGTVDGNQLKLVLMTACNPRSFSRRHGKARLWARPASNAFQEKQVKPGDKFSYLSYELP